MIFILHKTAAEESSPPCFVNIDPETGGFWAHNCSYGSNKHRGPNSPLMELEGGDSTFCQKEI